MHPWQEVTLDQLSPLAQRLISKMARSAAKDYFAERQEAEEGALQRVRDAGLERLTAQVIAEAKRQMDREGRRARYHALEEANALAAMTPEELTRWARENAEEAAARPEPPRGTCVLCGMRAVHETHWEALLVGGWTHTREEDCSGVRRKTQLPGMVLTSSVGHELTNCAACGSVWTPGTRMCADGKGGWMHRFSTECPPTHVDKHVCPSSGTTQNYCWQSCTACMFPHRAIPCPNVVGGTR